MAGNGFEVSHTENPETKGFVAWLMDHPTQGPNCRLLLLDTEGVHAIQEVSSYWHTHMNNDIMLFLLK
jgi:hypothetical protein